jgi:hypothetical protein
VIVPKPEFLEPAEDEPGAVDWLDAPETLGGAPIRRGRPRFAVVAAAVVAVLAATALILQANHAFGPGPNSRTVGSVDWRETLPGPSIGMWTTSDSVVVATVNGLTTYSLSRGEKLWSWAPPSGDKLCAISPTTSQGRGAVAFGAFDASDPDQITSCTAAQAIDVGTGRAAWPEPVDLTQGESPIFGSTAMSELSISDGFVVAPYGLNGLVSLDAATGARLWSSDQLPGYAVGAAGLCAEQGAQALDGEVYALSGNACSDGAVSVVVYNAAKIAPPQVLPLPDDSPHCDALARRIFATAADVLITCATFNGQSYPAYAIPQGTVQLVPLAVQGIGGITAADVAAEAGQLALNGGFVSGSGLVVESERTAGPITALTGLDLSTGTELWQRSFPAGTQFYPLGTGAGGALGVQTAGNDWTLLSVSPTTGATGSMVSLDPTALSGSGIDGSFDYAVVGSDVVAAELGANATVIVSTL